MRDHPVGVVVDGLGDDGLPSGSDGGSWQAWGIVAISLSVIIPTLNEAEQIEAVVRHLFALRPRPVEVLVVDGGSRDATVAKAQAAGARVCLLGQASRSRQLNHGARQAVGVMLLFLHADTRLHPSASSSLHRLLHDGEVVGGAFRRRFASSSRWLRLTSKLADWRVSLGGYSLGDQAQFVRRRTFLELGGFPDREHMEDLEFGSRLKRRGATRLIGPPVQSSARRFARGVVARSLGDAVLMVGHACRSALRH